ncbi:MAG: alpha/beta fold hydrolase [Ignavibacteria bacterium]|nr:alpha/beta fold hydrolase [Ignavibacteria bacterium]
MPLLLSLILIFILFLVGATLVVLVIGPLILLQPVRRTRQWYVPVTKMLMPRDAELPQEDLTLKTYDGISLRCWLVARSPQESCRGTILFLHGVGDCMIGGIPHAKLFYQHDYNVFLYDSRQHGASGGRFCTYGYFEKHDVSTVLDHLQSRSDLSLGRIGIFGTSMGAAVAVQAAALDDRICAIVAEACFTDLRTIAVDYQKRMIKLPWHFLRNVALSRAQRIADFTARDVSPLNDLSRLEIPIMFAHGTEDSFIDAEYSKILFQNAREPKELLLVPGAGHSNVLEVGGTVYEQRIIKFFDRYLETK